MTKAGALCASLGFVGFFALVPVFGTPNLVETVVLGFFVFLYFFSALLGLVGVIRGDPLGLTIPAIVIGLPLAFAVLCAANC